MRANTHFYVMITQFALLIYCIFSLIHSYDIQNIFSVVFDWASRPVSQYRKVHGSRLYAIGQEKNTVLRLTNARCCARAMKI